MKAHTAPYVAVMLIVLGTFSTVPRTPDPAVRVDSNAIGGVVTGPSGPEAGVWVIAETSELATKFVKIVVTDDQGRYLLPDLPKATYRVWVRGYGLVDSPALRAAPGRTLNLTAVVAPDARAAAQYYPAGYWFSLIHVPAQSEVGPAGADGNGGAGPQVRRPQRGHPRMELARSEGVPARRGLDRPPQPRAQRQRLDLRLARVERRLPAGAGSGAQHDEPGPARSA